MLIFENINQIAIFACFLCLYMKFGATLGPSDLPLEECTEAHIPEGKTV